MSDSELEFSRLLRESNPVLRDEFDTTTLSRILDRAIVSEIPQRSIERFRNRWLVGAAAAASLAVVVLIVLTALVLSGTAPSQSTGTGVLQWRLVSTIGSAWQRVPASGLGTVFDLTCPSSSRCYALNPISRDLEGTTDGGRTWRPITVGRDVILGYVISSNLSCSGPLTCSVIGSPDGQYVSHYSLYSTRNGGRTWAAGQVIPIEYPTTYSCATSTHCLVVGNELFYPRQAAMTTNGGKTWRGVPLPAHFDVDFGHCSASGDCLLFGSTDVPSLVDPFPAQYPSAQYPSAQAFFSNDGGAKWRIVALQRSNFVRSLSCVDLLTCYAVTRGGATPMQSVFLTSTDGGISFTAMPAHGFGFVPHPSTDLATGSVSCVSVGHCWVAGSDQVNRQTSLAGYTGQGFLSSTKNGGKSWAAATLPSNVEAVDTVTCPTTKICFAIAAVKAPQKGRYTYALLKLQD
jgi:photosystem II stability/assembly factor-like uncharacterized protein